MAHEHAWDVQLLHDMLAHHHGTVTALLGCGSGAFRRYALRVAAAAHAYVARHGDTHRVVLELLGAVPWRGKDDGLDAPAAWLLAELRGGRMGAPRARWALGLLVDAFPTDARRAALRAGVAALRRRGSASASRAPPEWHALLEYTALP